MSRTLTAAKFAFAMLALIASATLPATAEEPTSKPAIVPMKTRSPFVGELQVSNLLPNPFDRNMIHGSIVFQGAKEDEILSGKATITRAFEDRVDPKVRTDKLFQPSGTAIVRVEMEPRLTLELLGSKSASTADKQLLALNDDNGTQYLPIGFAWWKGETKESQIKIDRNDLIKTGHDIPFREVAPGKDQIFVYWQVRKGTKITSVNVGANTKLTRELQVPK